MITAEEQAMLDQKYEDLMDNGGTVDYDAGNLDWEIDHDWAAESLGNQMGELDKDDVIDNITIED